MARKTWEPGFSRVSTVLITATAVEMQKALAVASLKGFATAMEDAAVRLNRQQQAFIASVTVIPPGMRQQLHQDVGEAAQRSVVQAYSLRRYRKNTPPYRTAPRDERNRRFAGGMLLRALQAPDFFEATPNVLRWGNVARLNQEAVQWKRLNFGAGSLGAASGDSQVFQMRWGDFVGAAIGIPDDPQPAFKLPAGWWIGGEFYPRGEAPPGMVRGRAPRARWTRGIAASHFLDAGTRRIAEEYPKAVSAMMGRIYRDKPLAGRIQARTNVSIPMPSGVQRFGRLR